MAESATPLYISEKGSDETGAGTEDQPFLTLLRVSVRGYYSPESKSVSLQAMREAGKEPFPKFYTDSKQEGERWEELSQSQVKKIKKIWVREAYKQDKAEQRLVRNQINQFGPDRRRIVSHCRRTTRRSDRITWKRPNR
jgi:asparaginyl-tRNA synthetase